MRAWVDQDLAALDAFLAPDFALVIGNAPAACVSRAEWLAMIPRYVCTRFAYHDVQCRGLDELVLMSAVAGPPRRVDDIDRSGRSTSPTLAAARHRLAVTTSYLDPRRTGRRAGADVARDHRQPLGARNAGGGRIADDQGEVGREEGVERGESVPHLEARIQRSDAARTAAKSVSVGWGIAGLYGRV